MMTEKPSMVRGIVAGGVVEIPEEKAVRMGSDFVPEKAASPKNAASPKKQD